MEPCQAEREGAWASEAYLSDRNGSNWRWREEKLDTKTRTGFDFQMFMRMPNKVNAALRLKTSVFPPTERQKPLLRSHNVSPGCILPGGKGGGPPGPPIPCGPPADGGIPMPWAMEGGSDPGGGTGGKAPGGGRPAHTNQHNLLEGLVGTFVCIFAANC